MSRKPDEHPKFATDPLLDACLDELIGGKKPPNLKASILAQLAQEESQLAEPTPETEHDLQAKPASRKVQAGSTVERTSTTLPQIVTQSDHSPSHRARSRWTSPQWTSIAIGACLLAVIATTAFIKRDQLGLVDPIAKSGDSPATTTTAQDESPANNERPADQPSVDSIATDDSNNNSQDNDAPSPTVSADPAHDEIRIASDATSQPANDGSETDRQLPESRQTDERLSDAKVIAGINQHLRVAQQLAGVSAGVAISDTQWCERAYQRLLGRDPRSKELEAFVASSAADKRAAMVDQLLGETYAEEFASHWADQWSGWLLSRVPDRRNTLKTYRIGLSKFLASALKSDASYQQIAAQLLTAEGSNEPGRDDYDPATNFLLATLDDEVTEVTAQVCRTMLGQRTRCAQCHDDTRTRLTQDRFWSLAAVFKSVDVQRLRLGRGRIVDQQGVDSIRYQDESGDWKTATVRSTETADSNASTRDALAEKLVGSKGFRNAAINRLWAQLLQYGFTFPVDDMGSHNLVSHPRLLNLVSEQFAAADYDLQRALKWIVLSDAFNRSDRVDGGNLKDFPDGGSIALFSRDYYRPTVFAKATEGLSELVAGRRPQVAYADDESDPTVMQARRVKDLDAKERGVKEDVAMGQLLPTSYLRSVRQLADGGLSPTQQTDHAFLMTLSRLPTEAERKMAIKIFAETKKKDHAEALERIFWALLNTETAE